MRRPARLFTLCSAASLVLFLAIGVATAYSFGTRSAVRWVRHSAATGRYEVHDVDVGRALVVVESEVVDPADLVPSRSKIEWSAGKPGFWYGTGGRPTAVDLSEPWFGDRPWNRWGFGFAGTTVPLAGDRAVRLRTVVLPVWPLLIASGILPIAWLTRWRRNRRRCASRHCVHCGYDLRASPGRCPECGTPAAAASAEAPAAPPG